MQYVEEKLLACINNRSQLSKVTPRKLSTAFALPLSFARSWESLTLSVCPFSFWHRKSTCYHLPRSKCRRDAISSSFSSVSWAGCLAFLGSMPRNGLLWILRVVALECHKARKLTLDVRKRFLVSLNMSTSFSDSRSHSRSARS